MGDILPIYTSLEKVLYQYIAPIIALLGTAVLIYSIVNRQKTM
jgi:hypothetical protein